MQNAVPARISEDTGQASFPHFGKQGLEIVKYGIAGGLLLPGQKGQNVPQNALAEALNGIGNVPVLITGEVRVYKVAQINGLIRSGCCIFFRGLIKINTGSSFLRP